MSGDVARPLFVFMHGWGFDARLWDRMTALLPPEDCVVLDAGYFAVPRRYIPATGRPLIGVGHSYGTMALLGMTGVRWAGLAAINGFARFSFAQDYPVGVRRRLIDVMLKRFDGEPAAVLADFRARCGGDAPVPAIAATEGLSADLQALRDDDCRERMTALAVPKLLLAGGADAIVPPDLSRAVATSFGADVTIEWLSHGSHLLPLMAPEWCVGHLLALSARVTARV